MSLTNDAAFFRWMASVLGQHVEQCRGAAAILDMASSRSDDVRAFFKLEKVTTATGRPMPDGLDKLGTAGEEWKGPPE